MADTNNPKITLTLDDQATPSLNAIIASLKRLETAGEENNAWVTQLSTLLGQQQQAAQATTQSTNQLASAYVAMARAMQDQTQGYTQAQAAILAYRQQQDQLREALRQQREEQRKAADETQRWKDMLGQGVAVAGALGFVTSLEAGIRSLIDFGKEVVETGIKIQGLQLAFKGISGSAQNGAADFGFILRESQRLGLELTSTATTFRNFEAAAKGTTLEGQAARDIFTGFATAARSLGIQGADLTRVFFGLDRMMQTNVINMRELRQLSMAMPGTFDAFAKALGVTHAQLTEMIKSGTVLATDTLPAVAKEMLQLSATAGGDISVQAITAFTRLNNEITLLRNNIAQSGLLDLLRSLAEYAASILESGRKARGQQLREAGGPIAPLPPTLEGLAPDIQARQREITRLQESLLPQSWSMLAMSGGIPDLTGPLTDADREAVRTRIQALMAEQQKAIADFQGGIEAVTPGLPKPGPLETQLTKIQELMTAGRQKLAEIDLNATFIPSLTVAEDKLKSWQETLKAIREEFGKIPEPLRRAQVNPMSGDLSPFHAMIGSLAAERGLDPALIEALVAQESGGNPTVTSRKGAKGLLQLMPGTAAKYGAAGREFDPESNLRAGIAYLADLLKQFSGDITKALTAYNAGPRGEGIPQATGENATFARDVLNRLPTNISGLLGQATGQEAALQAAVEAGKPDREKLAQTMATGRARIQAVDDEIRAQEQAVTTLQRLIAGYTQTKEARDEDTAALLQAQFPHNAEIQTGAETLRTLAATRAAYKEEVTALQERFVALKQVTDAQREGEKVQANYLTKLQDTLAVLRAPKEDKVETQLRALATRQGVTLGPQEEGLLTAITAQTKANAQAKEMEQITQRLAGNIRQTFDTLWEQIFTGGITSARQFGLVVVQSLQKMFGQLTSQLMNRLLNAATNTADEKGGWAGALADVLAKVIMAPFGGGEPVATPDEAAGAIQGFRDAGYTQGIPFPSAQENSLPQGIGMVRALGGGGVVSRPSFALIGEQPEAVIPMAGGAVPVQFTGQSSQQQSPIVIEIHNDWSNTIAPSQLKTGRQEITRHIIDDYRTDGPIRRTIRQG